MAHETVSLSVSDGTNASAYVARPTQPSGKSIIVVQEAFGVNEYIRRMADRFADHLL